MKAENLSDILMGKTWNLQSLNKLGTLIMHSEKNKT